MILLLTIAASVTIAECRSNKTHRDWNQLDYNDCSFLEAQLADKNLAVVWKQAVRAAQKRDRVEPYRASGLETPRLDRAQRAWLKFRDEQCAFEEGLYGGGTAHTQGLYDCRAAITGTRIKQLSDFTRVR